MHWPHTMPIVPRTFPIFHSIDGHLKSFSTRNKWGNEESFALQLQAVSHQCLWGREAPGQTYHLAAKTNPIRICLSTNRLDGKLDLIFIKLSINENKTKEHRFVIIFRLFILCFCDLLTVSKKSFQFEVICSSHSRQRGCVHSSCREIIQNNL